MNRQRVKFSVTFPDYDRSEDVWVGGLVGRVVDRLHALEELDSPGGRVDALSGVEAIERAAKRAWESWLWECSSDFPIEAIATDGLSRLNRQPFDSQSTAIRQPADSAGVRLSPFCRDRFAAPTPPKPAGREWAGVVSLIPMPAFSVELD